MCSCIMALVSKLSVSQKFAFALKIELKQNSGQRLTAAIVALLRQNFFFIVVI